MISSPVDRAHHHLDLLPGAAPPLEGITIQGPGSLASAFDVDTLVEAAVVGAAAAIRAVGIDGATPIGIDRRRLHTTLTTHVRVDGATVPAWAELSGYYETGDDRLVQFHANFAHHAAGVRAVLGLASDADRDAVAAAVRTWPALELEAAMIDAGMIGAALRTLEEWATHPHAIATADLPLFEATRLGDAAPRPATVEADAPLAGVRVLDTSRVLAGPVAGQTLAAHGADVLRVGAAHLPAVEIGVLATGAGKRNTDVDLDTAEGRDTFETLLAGADIWIDAYRPGAFAERGFDAASVAERHPGLVAVQLSAFDWTGPWAGRRGFDSIVQSTTGVVRAGSRAAGASAPVPLPVQALDYATGWFAATIAARLLAHQRRAGGTWRGRCSLLRTRNELVGLGGPTAFTPAKPTPDPAALETVDAPGIGRLELPAAVLGAPATPPAPLGSSAPVWA